jgi:pimeloyl-ACP methyl ester carboxylesterase
MRDADPHTFLLLHGLGTTGAVWHGVERELRLQGAATLAPDLPGHGSAPAPPAYDVPHLARAVAACVPAGARVVVAGHSLGGYVALALASGAFGFTPRAALSLGAKLNFSDAERARGADIASKPVRWFATRAEAIARYRLVAGLPEQAVPDESYLERGVVAGPQGFRLAADPRAFAIEVPSFRELVDRALCPVRVARGAHDAIVTRAEYAALGLNALDLPGLGHNAQAEDAASVAALVRSLPSK